MCNMCMKTIEQIEKLTDKKFRRIFGVMRDKLNQQYTDSHKKGGRSPKINTLNRLCIFFTYYRDYEDIADEYDIIRLVEKTLISCKEFKLPDKII